MIAADSITGVVTIDLWRRPLNLLRRINALIPALKAQNLRITIGHNDRNSVYDRVLRLICKRGGVSLVSGNFYKGNINNSLLRNMAREEVKTPFMLLLDADIHLTSSTVDWLHDRVVGGEKPFQLLPCLYLTRTGTSRLLNGKVTPSALLSEYLRFARASFLHLALPSSVALFSTDDFDRLQGFDIQFSGHGYEDLDFLLRLSRLHGGVFEAAEMFSDESTRAPLLAFGFRSHLARLAFDPLLKRHTAFHLWHSTKRDCYYDARNDNAILFKKKLRAHATHDVDLDQKHPRIDLALIAEWQHACHLANVDSRQYSILFDNRPGHVDRNDTFVRRCKFLFGLY